MPQATSKIFTYQTRIHSEIDEDATLLTMSKLLSNVERKLFAAIAAGKKASDLKSSYLLTFGITARHFNACRIQVEGKIASIKERNLGRITELESRIKDLEKKIQNLEKRKANPRVIHQKKRRLTTLEHTYINLQNDQKLGKVRMCFGSKALFRAQFALTKNNYDSHLEWKADWEEQRNSSFFLVGSKDETAGNQLCTALIQDDGNLTLRLRLPDAIAKQHGKYLTIPNVHFQYGHDVLVSNIRNCQERGALCRLKDPSYKNYGEAISFRFQRDEKGWRVFASTSLVEPKWITHKAIGAIGIDINADHIAVTETDRFGNPIYHKAIPVVCYGKTSNQSKALIGDAVAEIVNLAQASQKPIILEKLDFQKKKTTLKESGYPKQARMLSSFSYKSIINSIHSRAFRFGVRVEEVNPAFTSLIGRVKFAEKYGLSIHESAALCIARRGLGVSERLPRHVEKVSDGKGHYVAFSLPVRNREKHVWRQWGQVQRKLTAVLAAHFRAKRSSSRSPPACCDR